MDDLTPMGEGTVAEASVASAEAAAEHWAAGSEFYDGVKQYATPLDVAKAYTEIQKMASQQVKIPEEGDAEGWAKMHARLGRPETPEQYELPVTEGVTQDDAYKAAIQKAAFENGLSQKQLAALASVSDQFIGMSQAEQQAEAEKLNAARWDKLKWDDAKKTEATEHLKRGILKFSELHPDLELSALMLDVDETGKANLKNQNDPLMISFANFLMDYQKDDSGLIRGDMSGGGGDDWKPEHGPDTYRFGEHPDTLKARAYYEKLGHKY